MKTMIMILLLLEGCNFVMLVSAAPTHGHQHRHRRVTRTSSSNVGSATTQHIESLIPDYTSTPSIIVVQPPVDNDVLFLRQNESEALVARNGDGKGPNGSSADHNARSSGMEDYEAIWDRTAIGWTALGLAVGVLVAA